MEINRGDRFKVIQQNDQFASDIQIVEATNRHIKFIYRDAPPDKCKAESVTRLHFEKQVHNGVIGKILEPGKTPRFIWEEDPADELPATRFSGMVQKRLEATNRK